MSLGNDPIKQEVGGLDFRLRPTNTDPQGHRTYLWVS